MTTHYDIPGDEPEVEKVEVVDEEVYGLCEYCHHQGDGPNCYRCEWIASDEELEEGVFCDWYEPYYEEDDDEWVEEVDNKVKVYPTIDGELINPVDGKGTWILPEE